MLDKEKMLGISIFSISNYMYVIYPYAKSLIICKSCTKFLVCKCFHFGLVLNVFVRWKLDNLTNIDDFRKSRKIVFEININS